MYVILFNAQPGRRDDGPHFHEIRASFARSCQTLSFSSLFLVQTTVAVSSRPMARGGGFEDWASRRKSGQKGNSGCVVAARTRIRKNVRGDLVVTIDGQRTSSTSTQPSIHAASAIPSIPRHFSEGNPPLPEPSSCHN